MAASGNVQTDLLSKFFKFKQDHKSQLLTSQIVTLSIGVLALVLASFMTNVLELMLYSYAFMVSGLFIPILVALYGKRPNSLAAILSMIIGGTTTVALIISNLDLPFGLDANIFGISASAFIYFLVTLISKK